jgi:DNA-damage-inducible protein D
LSWSHYVELLKIDDDVERAFYEKQAISDHFVDVNKMVSLGSGSERSIEDIMLSRYACGGKTVYKEES